MIYKEYKTKSVLNIQKKTDSWFWAKYSVSAYSGCEWGCHFCYSRDEKYNPYKPGKNPNIDKLSDPFSQYIKIKINAPELLDKALAKKPVDLIYVSGYQPVESKYNLTRKLLEVCFERNFPVFVNERSPLLLKDLDLLTQIKDQSFMNVGWSIISAEDNDDFRVFEPKSPTIESRFSAMKKVSEAGIMTGTIFMPVLPLVFDSEENIEKIVKRTKECGGQYVLDGGLTLWGYCGDYFFEVLKKQKPELIASYRELYGSKREENNQGIRLHKMVRKYCKKYGLTPFIPRPTSFYPERIKMNKRVAGNFLLRAKELQMTGNGGTDEWRYRKAGWQIDEMAEDILKIYESLGLDGLKKIPNLDMDLAVEIKNLLDKL